MITILQLHLTIFKTQFAPFYIVQTNDFVKYVKQKSKKENNW